MLITEHLHWNHKDLDSDKSQPAISSHVTLGKFPNNKVMVR